MIFDNLMIFLQQISEDYLNEHHEKVNENSKIHQLFPKIAQKKKLMYISFQKSLLHFRPWKSYTFKSGLSE